jgi:hypothetical protein
MLTPRSFSEASTLFSQAFCGLRFVEFFAAFSERSGRRGAFPAMAVLAAKARVDVDGNSRELVFNHRCVYLTKRDDCSA